SARGRRAASPDRAALQKNLQTLKNCFILKINKLTTKTTQKTRHFAALLPRLMIQIKFSPILLC
ncbi:hypothetical protein ACTVMP_15055, partial [Serratia marcescens]|uniref:hypothetical protein n=1 Tax=Serratia marcescens TaxID=615 RepID=UPI003FA7E120